MMPAFDLGQGRVFIPSSRHYDEFKLFGDLDHNQLRAWVCDRWSDAFEAKRAETERLKAMELYWAGFHYQDAWLNKSRPITNYCFAHVETLHPILTEAKPRPEIAPRRSMADQRIASLRETAQWYMDRSWFDAAVSQGTRDKLKYGYSIHLVTFDPKTGFPKPGHVSVFDFYRDPAARNESELDHFFIGMPVSTIRLRKIFPKCASEIVPDNMASPGYDVLVRPYKEASGDSSGSIGVQTVGPRMNYEGSGLVSGSTPYVTSTGQYMEHGHTTFLIQMFVRDYGTQPVLYRGDLMTPDLDDPQGRPISTPYSMKHDEPRCESGWCVITMTASGKILDCAPLDTCFLGLPIVIGRDYPTNDRFESKGELDDLIPLQRAVNRRKYLLDRALELAANPPVITNNNSGLPANTSVINGGDILRIRPGTDVKYLDFRGPAEWQFNMLSIDQRDFDTVGGAHDVTQGQRPAGIEAMGAIQELKESAQVRIRGKLPEMYREYGSLLTKCLYAMGRKFGPSLRLRATRGIDFSVLADDLLDDYEVVFAEGSGTVMARDKQRMEAKELFQLGLVDEAYVWDALDIKGREEMAQRFAARQELERKAQEEAAKEQNGGQRGGVASNAGRSR